MKQKQQKTSLVLKKPNPPSSDDINRAQFIDKTYRWKGRFRNKKSGQFQTGSLEKCPSCGSDTKIQNSRVSKKTGAWSRRCICKSCGQRFVAVYGVRPSDLNPNYRHKTSERVDRKGFTCKTCEHWWGGRCEKGQTLTGCTSYESCI